MFTAATTIEDVRQQLRAVTLRIRPDGHLSKAPAPGLGRGRSVALSRVEQVGGAEAGFGCESGGAMDTKATAKPGIVTVAG